MCGRYAASRSPEDLASIFDIERWEPTEALPADWNVAPTKEVYAVLDRPLKGAGPEPVRQLRVLRWGLVPSWAKSPESAAKMINARSETVHERASYRRAFAARRCLLPADGYYEWATGDEERTEEVKGKRKRPRKQPYFVTPADGSVMALAGLYEFWRDATLPEDHPRAWWVTCTVLTTEAEATPLADAPPGTPQSAGPAVGGAAKGPRSLADIHPRMPLMLLPDRWDAWLDPSRTDPEEIRELLTPPPAGTVRAHPVTRDVSNVRNNGPELVAALPAPEEETLF
ncbi:MULTISPECIES: SOS response-associated peptidase [Streptomyces]|uniref:Abasic site processing protein n=2 Tax=Streptomyces TaxID=1883 RepID=A0A1I6UBF6_9ACTN|nr:MULTISPECIES: SOS response-associated peptidase [Streptomyces]MCK1813720.1 SOS response-associated peptidase [Streptomyces sp. XM4011]QKV70762.1 SOS response-associated peptidase [Streptomyces harbinensis]SFS98741.1 Putative SOS response-associated peptidase YedK [Streptomyces harbinensis]